MRTIKQYLEAAKARKENGEAGFSLVELIVVVVILGILAAVAIPIFANIQGQARENAVKAAAASAVSQVTAALAVSPTATPALPPNNAEFTFAWSGGAPSAANGGVGDVCITATSVADTTKTSTQGTRVGCA